MKEKLGLLAHRYGPKKLREGSPSIEASDMRRFNPPWKGLGLFPYLLQAGEETIIADRIKEIIKEQASRA